MAFFKQKTAYEIGVRLEGSEMCIRDRAILDTKIDKDLHFIPTVAREVFDVSGAGDTAISAIAASLACGASLTEAAWVGNCASGVVVGKKGTALVDQIELQKYFNELDHIGE